MQAQAALAKAARREEERDAVHAGEVERLRALDRKHEEQAEKAAAEARRLAEARVRKAEAARDEAVAAAARSASAVAAAEAAARLEHDRAAALEAEVEAATEQAEDERENAAELGTSLQSERQILRSMSVLMRSRLSELVGEAGGDGTAEAANELEAMLSRGGELEEQLHHKERLVARQGELLGAAAVDRLTSLRRTAARRTEAETLYRRAGEVLAALPAPRRTKRVASLISPCKACCCAAVAAVTRLHSGDSRWQPNPGFSPTITNHKQSVTTANSCSSLAPGCKSATSITVEGPRDGRGSKYRCFHRGPS